MIFSCMGMSAPNPCVFKGQLYYQKRDYLLCGSDFIRRKPLRGTQAFQKEGLSLQVWWSRSYVKETHMTNCRQPLGTIGLYDLRVATSQPSAKFLGPQSHKHKEINSANTLNNLRSDSSQSSLQILRKPSQYFNFNLTRPKSGDQVKPGSDFWPTQTMKLWYLSC